MRPSDKDKILHLKQFEEVSYRDQVLLKEAKGFVNGKKPTPLSVRQRFV